MLAPITATGLKRSGFVASGRDTQSIAFLSAPGIEWLYSGVVKKTALSAYGNIRNTGIIAIGLEDGDELIGVEITSGRDHVILGTKSGLAVRFEETDVRAMGRPAAGVTGARFKREGDEVVSMIVVPNGDNGCCQVFTACVQGYGKRTPRTKT